MRTAEDLGYRARNWFWYWRVRQISGLSNQQLDEKAFGDVGRKRHFERIQHTASSPDQVVLVGCRTLLQLVDHWMVADTPLAKPFADATTAFRSPLWDFLVKRDVEPAQYTNFIQQTIAARGWHRAHGRDLGLYREFLGESEPAIEGPCGVAYSAMLHRLANEATPDSLAMLIALFREAMHAVRLQEAVLIKSAITTAVHWMCHRLQMPAAPTRLLAQLVDDRVLANIWITEADWRERTGRRPAAAKGSRDRLKEFRAWVDWYVRLGPRQFQADYCSSPIVPASPRIDWLESNRTLLERAHDDMCGAGDDYQFRLLGTGLDDDSPWLNRQEFSASVARALGRPEEPSPRFYTESPSLVIGRLPSPY